MRRGVHKPIEGRFWERTVETESGCWEFPTRTKRSRPNVYYEGKVWRASRLAYTLARGPIPDGLLVCHHCDNGHCIRPSHLFLGTHKDNAVDMLMKGRGSPPPLIPRPGELSPMAKLTESQVRQIRAMHVPWSHKFGSAALGRMFGVCRQAVDDIISHKNWKHVA